MNDPTPLPPKPRPDFPLFPHRSGKWAKKIKGKRYYFGKWDDPEGALAEYEAFLNPKPTEPEKPATAVLTVSDACNHFLAAKKKEVTSNQLSPRSFNDYKRTSRRMVSFWGRDRAWSTLQPTDFSAYRARVLETCNPITTGNEITRVKTIAKWLQASKYIDQCDFGPDFRKPSAKFARRHKRQQGEKFYQPDQVRLFMDESGIHLRAMILLAINCGYGNEDCNQLLLKVAQQALRTGWIHHPRPKTEVDRRCPLWPETRKALKRSLLRRIKSKLPNAFVMANGRAFTDENNDIAKRFRVARLAANVREGGFYWLRHTFETVAGASKDQVAVNSIMGHVDSSMAATYRESIGDDRLLAVTKTVRDWLFRRTAQ